jgi:TPR repeat protein
MWRLIPPALLMAAVPANAAQPGLAAVVEAWEAGDWPQARARLRPLALRGDPAAETLLGVMAARGLGAPADKAVAAAWYLRAARSGHVPARLALADAYRRGEGLPRNPARAALIEQALASERR